MKTNGATCCRCGKSLTLQAWVIAKDAYACSYKCYQYAREENGGEYVPQRKDGR